MEPAQRKIYQHTREYYRKLLLGMIEEEGLDDTRMKILEGLLRLRQASIHPALLEPTYHGDAPKFELLLETLETLRSEGHKALIFSQFVEVLKLLREQMDALGLRYAYLDGQTTTGRCRSMPSRKSGHSLLPYQLKAGGLGLNLTAATTSSILTRGGILPSNSRPATGAPHRPGQARLRLQADHPRLGRGEDLVLQERSSSWWRSSSAAKVASSSRSPWTTSRRCLAKIDSHT
jgi:non-specific serine/threonine protein kinase